MNKRLISSCCTAAMFAWCLPGAMPVAVAQQNKTSPLAEPEVLAQGPIHEAFAEAFTMDPPQAEVVSREPPPPIQELPSEIKPEGRNVQWIPGYFQWDRDREDFVWVSGFYREVPPGREWVPGEWHQVEGGWQWTSGFWADAEQQELQYLPTPPESLEQGPSSPAPGEDYLWAPGCWRWDGSGYAWRPGYWYRAQPNWVWVPSHYTYTSHGCVYVSGYWDFPFARRGLLFAPVYWHGGYGGYAGHYWRPHQVLNTALLVTSLFVDHGHHHYYYGYHDDHPDWIHPWGHKHGRHGHVGRLGYYDPLWAHHGWKHRHGHEDFDRDDDRDRRERDGRNREAEVRDDRRGRDQDRLITTVDDLRQDGHKEMKLRKLSEQELSAQQRRAERLRDYQRVPLAKHRDAEAPAGDGPIVRRQATSQASERTAADQVQRGGSERRQGRLREGASATTESHVQSDRRFRDDSHRRMESPGRQETSGAGTLRAFSLPSTFRQQGKRESIQAPQNDSTARQGSPRRDYRVMREPTSQESFRGGTERSSGRVRSFTQEGRSGQATRAPNSRSSENRGGRESNRRGRSDGGGGGGGGENRRSGGGGKKDRDK